MFRKLEKIIIQWIAPLLTHLLYNTGEKDRSLESTSVLNTLIICRNDSFVFGKTRILVFRYYRFYKI